MIGHPRAGNIFLTRVLDQSPRVNCPGEIFNTDLNHDHVRAAATALGVAAPLTIKQVPKLVSLVATREGVDHVGLTLFDKPVHSLPVGDIEKLADGRCPIVLLHRLDLLKAFCSWERACRSNVWHRDETGEMVRWESEGDAIADQDRFTVDMDAAGAWIARTTAFLDAIRAHLGKTKSPIIEMTYEELCSPDADVSAAAIDRIRETIGAPPFPYKVKTSRTSSDDDYAKIENWAALRAKFPPRTAAAA